MVSDHLKFLKTNILPKIHKYIWRARWIYWPTYLLPLKACLTSHFIVVFVYKVLLAHLDYQATHGIWRGRLLILADSLVCLLPNMAFWKNTITFPLKFYKSEELICCGNTSGHSLNMYVSFCNTMLCHKVGGTTKRNKSMVSEALLLYLVMGIHSNCWSWHCHQYGGGMHNT